MLVILIIAMTLIAVLGASFVSFVGSKQQGFTYLLNGHRANMIAKAGVEWAIRFASEGNDVSDIENKNFVWGKPEEGSFSTSYNDDEDVLTVDGTYQGVKATITLSNFRRYLKSGDISFPLSMDSFVPVESQAGKSITVEQTGVIRLGQGVRDTFGAIWYRGSSAVGNCFDGSCDFGSGFRAYFVFQFAPNSKGDGFTFAVINGTNNTASSIGGDTKAGELMGYGGDSRSYSGDYITSFVDGSGNGLRPPKFAVEFDIFPNMGCDPCSLNSRCDLSNQHIAYVFWGDDNRIDCMDNYTRWISSFSFLANTVIYGNPTIYKYISMENFKTGLSEPNWESCTTSGSECIDNNGSGRWQFFDGSQTPVEYATNSRTYDDNRHTAGTGDNWGNSITRIGPENKRSGESYYESSYNPTAWLADRVNSFTVNHTYAYRMEVVRDRAAGTYTIKSWIIACDPTWSPSTPYEINDQVIPPENNGYNYIALTPGTSGADEPTWSTDETVTDGTAVTWAPIKKWNPATAYRSNDLVMPTVNNGYNYIARIPGTSGAAEPTWSASRTVTDGTVTWEPVPMTICSKYTNGAFGDVRSDYTADSPRLERTVTLLDTTYLDTTYNDAFDKFLFGWTTASGGATQKADVWKFRMSFRR